jgi:hypothetical protein
MSGVEIFPDNDGAEPDTFRATIDPALKARIEEALTLQTDTNVIVREFGVTAVEAAFNDPNFGGQDAA